MEDMQTQVTQLEGKLDQLQKIGGESGIDIPKVQCHTCKTIAKHHLAKLRQYAVALYFCGT